MPAEGTNAARSPRRDFGISRFISRSSVSAQCATTERFRRLSWMPGLAPRSNFARAPAFRNLNRLAAEIAAVQSEEIEGVEEGLVLTGAPSELEA
jgi:hypothetical protein